jgi:hypothetical protein
LLAQAPRDRFSLLRFLVEQLVWRDIHGSLNKLGTVPTVLKEEDVELFVDAGTWSRSDDEWESFERMFGEVVTTACHLIY